MFQARRFREYLLLLANRGAVPLTTFLALAFFQRSMAEADLELYLLAFSLNQWILAFGFQWQKNAAVRFSHYESYNRIGGISLVVTMGASAAFYVLFSNYTNIPVLIGGLIYTLLAGALYYVSTNYRMKGSVALYANIDTASHVLRWGTAVVAVALVPLPDSPFWGAAVSVIAALAVFARLMRNRALADGPNLTWRTYLSAGLWLALFDFAGSGMMYIDRFYVHDVNYILHSTVSNQIGSVLFGALIATAYPRIMLAWREGKYRWRSEYKHFARFVLPLIGFTAVLCAVAGPFLLWVLSPEAAVELRVLVVLGLCQSLHHIIYFLSIVFILHSRNYVCACVYLGCLASYYIALMCVGSHEWIVVAGLKLLFLALTAIIVFLVAYRYTKGSQKHA